MISYRADLQNLRGIAVLLVLFYHLEIPGFSNGFLGVDVFFVLSGFLMATLCGRGTVVDFYSRRLKRLLPAYFVTIIVTTLAVAFLTVPVDSGQRFERIWFDIFGASNLAFWLENSYFDVLSFKPLLNLWSLGVELQFYLIAPLILPFFQRRPMLLVATIVLATGTSLVGTAISPKTSFFMMPFRLWEFLLGALVAWHAASLFTVIRSKWFCLSLLAASIAVIVFYPIDGHAFSSVYGHPGIAAVVVALSTAVLIATPDIFPVNSKLLEKLGDYSYSIYLVHFPVIVLVNYQEFGGTRLGYQAYWDLIVILALTIVLSYLLYNYVEKIRSFKHSMSWVLFLAGATAVAALITPVINEKQYTSEQNKIFAAWDDRNRSRCGRVNRLLNPFESVCKLGGSDGDLRVLLLGNSHAHSIRESFTNEMNKLHLATYFYVQNNPLMSSLTGANSIVEQVKNLKIDHVVIHYSPGFYERATNIEQLSLFLQSMQELEKPVRFISPVPTYAYHVPKELYRLTLDDNNSQPSPLEFEEYLESVKDFSYLMRELGIEPVSIFRTEEYLCDGSTCLMEVDGRPLYFDSGHLTLTGAETLAPLFIQIGRDIIE